MTGFTTKINLYNKEIFVKELKLKHFKTLLKTLINENNINDIYYNLVNILSDLTDLETKDIELLSVIDFLLLVLHIRCISTGSIVQLEIEGQQNKKVDLNLYKVIETIFSSFNFNFKQKIENLEINYTTPSIKDYLFDYNNTSELTSIKKYINSIYIVNYETIDITKLDDNSFLQFFNSLPANYSAVILQHITQLVTELNNINLLEHLIKHNLSLYLSPDNFVFILQILFSKNLMPLYENIFALCKFTNLTPEYLENCTPGEYTIFVKLLERILKEQAVQQNKSTLPPINANSPNFM